MKKSELKELIRELIEESDQRASSNELYGSERDAVVKTQSAEYKNALDSAYGVNSDMSRMILNLRMVEKNEPNMFPKYLEYAINANKSGIKLNATAAHKAGDWRLKYSSLRSALVHIKQILERYDEGIKWCKEKKKTDTASARYYDSKLESYEKGKKTVQKLIMPIKSKLSSLSNWTKADVIETAYKLFKGLISDESFFEMDR